MQEVLAGPLISLLCGLGGVKPPFWPQFPYL